MSNLGDDVGTRIIQLREQRGFSLRQLCDQLDEFHGKLGRVERGEASHPPTYDLLHAVATVLDVEPGDFFYFPWSVDGRTPLRHIAHEQVRLTREKDLRRLVERLKEFAQPTIDDFHTIGQQAVGGGRHTR